MVTAVVQESAAAILQTFQKFQNSQLPFPVKPLECAAASNVKVPITPNGHTALAKVGIFVAITIATSAFLLLVLLAGLATHSDRNQLSFRVRNSTNCPLP